ncbi:MAG: CDP-glucose 4,6-dehydratase [Sandaracinaceae bacterium]
MTSALREAYRSRRVLVTGDTGFKGAWLVHWLRSLDAEVFGLALPPEEGSVYARTGLGLYSRHVDCDIRDLAACRAAVDEARPDVVFHLAAQALVRPSYEAPVDTFATNVMGTVHVLDVIRERAEPAAVVVVTSDKCYENSEWAFAYRETDPLGGHDPYSASKGASEIVASSYRRSFLDEMGVHVASARAGNVVGPGDWSPARIVPDIMRGLFAGEPVVLRNPQAVRPWQHVLEPLSGYLWLGAKLQGPDAASFSKAYNFGPGPESCRTVAELVAVTQAALGGGRSQDDPGGAHPHEAGTLRLAIDRASSELRWRPVWDFRQTLTRTAKGYAALRDAVDADTAAGVVVGEIDAYTADAADLGVPWAQAVPLNGEAQ